MVFLFVVGIIILVIYSVRTNAENERKRSEAAKKFLEDNRFRIRVRSDSVKLDDGTAVRCFFIEAKGTLFAPRAGFPVHNVITIVDKTKNGDPRPIFCQLEDWREPEHNTVCHVGTRQELPYEATSIRDWMVLGALPIESLVFPERGELTLEFKVVVFSAETKDSIARDSASFVHRNSELGYIDGEQARANARVAAVRMAVLVSGCDGSHEAREGEIIKEWVNRQLEASPESGRSVLRNRFNGAIREHFGTHDFSEIRELLRNYARQVNDSVPMGDRYAIMELLMDVAKADGVASSAELAMLEETSRHLGLEPSKFRSLRDKHLPITIHEVAAGASGTEREDRLLGLKPGMSPDAIRSHLNQEYRKWNNRSEHPDPEIRKQAREMIKLIASARQRHTSAAVA